MGRTPAARVAAPPIEIETLSKYCSEAKCGNLPEPDTRPKKSYSQKEESEKGRTLDRNDDTPRLPVCGTPLMNSREGPERIKNFSYVIGVAVMRHVARNGGYSEQEEDNARGGQQACIQIDPRHHQSDTRPSVPDHSQKGEDPVP